MSTREGRPFAPIAVVGRDVLFPGIRGPTALGDAIGAGRDLVGSVPAGRWRIDPARVLARPGEDAADRTRSDRGGYVEGFRFDPHRYRIPPEQLGDLDPLFHWALACASGALDDVGGPKGRAPEGRRAAVMGLLGFPSGGLAQLAETTWGLSEVPVDPRDRFMSGLPALLLREGLGLEGPAFSLDAACASSLYAVKIACDMLQDDEADLVLAGAVNRADDLFIHIGFTALDALSSSGRSRPFHADADGLLPAEGAGFLALCRYEDAVADRLPIHGVIRGVGLANDGRARSLLAPASSGQIRSMRAAFAGSGLGPEDIGLVECHATGTPVGDATEIRSLAEVYGKDRELLLGSIKSNLGHPITAAGMAGMTKVMEAFARGRCPPTLHLDRPNPALLETRYRVPRAEEALEGPRRAAVSAFGFGGNDAHVLLEAPDAYRAPARRPRPRPPTRLAVVGWAAQAGAAGDSAAFASALLEPPPDRPRGRMDAVELSMKGLRFPPRSLEKSLPQQKAILSCLQDALQRLPVELEGRTAGVYVGMGCDPEVARWGARWRADDADPRRDQLAPPLTADAVVGTMPNMPANRVSSWLDLKGPSFSVSSEETSGPTALALATRALARGEIELAVVGATDFSVEPVHAQAKAALAADAEPGDGAAVLVLTTPDHARALDLPIWAELELGDRAAEAPPVIAPRFGEAHAARALLEVVAQVELVASRRRSGGGVEPRPTPRAVVTKDLLGGRSAVTVHPGPSGSAPPGGQGRRLHVYEGRDRDALLEEAGRANGRPAPDPDHAGPRLVLAAPEGSPRAALAHQAAAALRSGDPLPDGVAFAEAPIGGELAFVFGGAGAAYPGMGRPLLERLPELASRLSERFDRWEPAFRWSLEGQSSQSVPELLWGASTLAQLHAELSRGLLGLRPDAALGCSTGESDALFALGAWRDLDAMFDAAERGGLYTRELAGELAAVRRAWGVSQVDWQVWVLRAPVSAIELAVAEEPCAHLTLIHTDDEATIAGDASACQRVIARLGVSRARPLPFPLAVHVPELTEVEAAWRALHRREVHPVAGVRFYGHATGSSYALGEEACADAITRQAMGTVDLRATVEQAWSDGVRVFLEHGPRGATTRWISEILGERPHLAVALDRREDPLGGLWSTLCQLTAAGVRLDPSAVERADRPWPIARPRPTLVHPAHPTPVAPARAPRVAPRDRPEAPRPDTGSTTMAPRTPTDDAPAPASSAPDRKSVV